MNEYIIKMKNKPLKKLDLPFLTKNEALHYIDRFCNGRSNFSILYDINTDRYYIWAGGD